MKASKQAKVGPVCTAYTIHAQPTFNIMAYILYTTLCIYECVCLCVIIDKGKRMRETNCGGSCDFVDFYSQFIATCSIIVVVVAVAIPISFVRSFVFFLVSKVLSGFMNMKDENK